MNFSVVYSFVLIGESINQLSIQCSPEIQIFLLPTTGWNLCFTFERFQVQFSAPIPSTLTDALLRLSAKCPVSDGGGTGSMPGQFTWDLWWKKWHWDGFLSEYLGFSPCQYHSNIASPSLALTLCDLNNGQRHSITQIMKCEDINSATTTSLRIISHASI